MGRTAVVVLVLVVPLTLAEQPRSAPAIVLTDRRGEVVPLRSGCTYVGGGTIDVRQPAADTVIVTMVGAVVATGHPCGSSAVMDFDVDQSFEVTGGRCKLALEAEAVGLIRGGRNARAQLEGYAAVFAGDAQVVNAPVCGDAVSGGENLTINHKTAPDDMVVVSGKYHLYTRWRLAATHPAGLFGKAASAEFAPEPALDPLWVGGPRDPFHGIAKKDFGLRVTLRVTPAAQ